MDAISYLFRQVLSVSGTTFAFTTAILATYILMFGLMRAVGFPILFRVPLVSHVMTVQLGLLFSFHLSSPYCTTDPPFPLLLVIALSWTYLLTPRLGQDALWTVCSSPYLLHTLPSLLLYYLHVHQYLLMCTLRAPPMPAPPHCCLMYHCTVCACYRTPLHV
jgi:hypothetical protein